jgi:hypothetical protein
MKKKTNPQDATLRNIRAAKKRIAQLELEHEKLLRLVKKYVNVGVPHDAELALIEQEIKAEKAAK